MDLFVVADPEHEREDLIAHFGRERLMDAGQRRVDRGGSSSGSSPRKRSSERESAPPGDAVLTVDSLGVAEEQHLEVDAGSNGTLAAWGVLFVVGKAASFDPGGEPGVGQEGGDRLEEGVFRRLPVGARKSCA